MPETTNPNYQTGDAVCDTLRFLCDASYAVLPRDVAHQVAELQKNFWGGVRWLAEKRVEWIEARVAGGDRLREEWRQRRNERRAAATGPENLYETPGEV